MLFPLLGMALFLTLTWPFPLHLNFTSSKSPSLITLKVPVLCFHYSSDHNVQLFYLKLQAL